MDHINYMTSTDVARKVGVCAHTILRWSNKGIMSPKRNENGIRYYSEEDLKKAIQYRKLTRLR